MKKASLILLLLLVFILEGCSFYNASPVNDEDNIKSTAVLSLGRDKLQELPVYNKLLSEQLQIDLRSYDLTSLDIGNRYEDLIHADFDTNTKWPYNLPEGFNPKQIMEYGKNPGLKIEDLHDQNINGAGVNIAIIGDALLQNHSEYKGQLKLYENIHCLDKKSTESGCAAASIAVGETTGIAPQAKLYYVANTAGKYEGDKFIADLTWLASAIDKVIEINNGLPKNKKIRVLSIGAEISKEDKGYDSLLKTANKAKDSGIFVVSSMIYDMYTSYDVNRIEFEYQGLGRLPMSEPDELTSYVPGIQWANSFYSFTRNTRAIETLLVPADSRCTASPTGVKDYAFYTIGRNNVSSAYIAGLYALACQVKPNITPQIFWRAALETGDVTKIKSSYINYTYTLRRIVNPTKLFESLKAK